MDGGTSTAAGRAGQRGDKHAFELLVFEVPRKLARLLARFYRDPARSRMSHRKQFIKAYRACPSFRGDSAFYTGCIASASIPPELSGAMGRRAPTTTEFNSEDAESFEDGEQLRDINYARGMMCPRRLRACKRQHGAVPEELRDAITLRELEGLSYEDIATIMNCPIAPSALRISVHGAIANNCDLCSRRARTKVVTMRKNYRAH